MSQLDPATGTQVRHHATKDLAHKERILASILKRIDRQKNTQNVGIGVQSDLESESDDQDDRIEQIVNTKSKSIADVLLNEGLA